MPLKNKTMALIRVRKTPYSGLPSFLQDVFYKQELLADKAFLLLKVIYSKKTLVTDWKLLVKELFGVDSPSTGDESVISEACFKYLGFHRENITASKAKLRGKKAFKDLLSDPSLEASYRDVLMRASKWHSAVTSYYSILNKLKALGLIEKADGYYVRSDKFLNRLSQVNSLFEGFSNELR